jgi:hypothetical protein
LIPEAFAALKQAQLNNNLAINPAYLDPYTLIKTFLNILSSFLHDYISYGEKLSANKISHSTTIISASAQPPLPVGLKKMMTLDVKAIDNAKNK